MLLTHLETMVFHGRNRGMSLRPVNRIKHVVDFQGGVALGVVQNVILALANDNPVLANNEEVLTGSKVNGVYLKVEIYARTAGALANCYMTVAKNPGGNLTIPNPNAVGINDNKKYVFHQEMVMLERKVNGNPRTLFNGVIVVPKLYRRQGPNDNLLLSVLAPGVDIDLCVQCHYKEFR